MLRATFEKGTLMATKLYTKKGDRGRTSLFSGRQTAKFEPRIAAVGDLDELSASLGLARVAYPAASDILRAAQRTIYAISAIVSAEGQHELAFDTGAVETLETEIDRGTDALPPLREFIFPGEDKSSCRLHMARAIARRAERSISALENPAPPDSVLAYLNRLSDLLFVVAREADQRVGQPDKAFRT